MGISEGQAGGWGMLETMGRMGGTEMSNTTIGYGCGFCGFTTDNHEEYINHFTCTKNNSPRYKLAGIFLKFGYKPSGMSAGLFDSLMEWKESK